MCGNLLQPIQVSGAKMVKLMQLFITIKISVASMASPLAAPTPFYNQAYNETYPPDSVPYIIAHAENAYILLDPYDEDVQKNIVKLKANHNTLGAYISIGTGEDWRTDFKTMQPFLVKTQWDQWHGEYFVSNPQSGLIKIMQARINYIAALGFDWVEFDNMDWAFDDKLRKKYKFKITEPQSIHYFNELCRYVHSKGLKCMAKNMPENIDNFDGITFESYEADKNWWDVDAAQKFLKADKLFVIDHYNSPNCNAVFNDYKKIYNSNISFICEDAKLKKYIHYGQ